MAEHWMIVGAGSAGCVLANRLSADTTRHVTLLDDGPALSPGQVPTGIDSASFFDALAEPGRMHAELMARRVSGGESTLYQRGRGVGGSSAVNAMVALPGSTSIYERWGWSDTAAAFAQVELSIETPESSEIGAVSQALLTAEPSAEVAQLTRANGRRVTSAEAYVWPVLSRPNLQVRPDAEVHRVTFNGTKTTGVELETGETIAADHVVMAAGAVHTPAVLLRSGVSTPGVGQGLQDHPSAVITLALHDHVPYDPAGLVVDSTLHVSVRDDLLQFLPMNHLGPDPATHGLGALLIALMTPTSAKGTVSIDTNGDPVVDFAFLRNDHDIDLLTAATRRGREILAHDAFRAIVDQAFIDDQGTPLAQLNSDEATRSWLVDACGDYVHASSSCAMGTVVDDRFSVIGHERLWICDASVFPTVPDANTHLPTTMLAERFSNQLTMSS